MEANKNITAVEWFIENTTNSGHLWTTDKPSDMKQLVEFIKQAKEMEREQIKNAYDQMRCVGNFENGEQYYNETYGSK